LFFFSSRRRHTRSDRDWSSDVCSSDLLGRIGSPPEGGYRGLASGGEPSAGGVRRLQDPLPEAPLSAAEEPQALAVAPLFRRGQRSEERRVGKEGRSLCVSDQEK